MVVPSPLTNNYSSYHLGLGMILLTLLVTTIIREANDDSKQKESHPRFPNWVWRFFWGATSTKLSSEKRHPPDSVAYAIESHILQTQKPAQALGIRVEAFDESNGGTFLALKAPLTHNTNVHQTAFAGSLFSIGVLTSFYLIRQWMIQQKLQDTYTLVARSANIRYRRPVRTAWIVAQSTLPHKDLLEDFRHELMSTGKAMIHVKGIILQPADPLDGSSATVEACGYSVECCAYLPRS